MSLPDFGTVIAAYESVERPLDKWLGEAKTRALGAVLRSRATQRQPQVMVYGVYNAGKSTLLNALMGRAEAPMSDRPETAKVTPYQWRGYTLLDTPGIDAPMEHEDITREQLDRCDVVLFVIATGSSLDEARTWQELTAIAQRGRRLLIVVNNKHGLDRDSAAYAETLDKLRANLQQAAAQAGVEKILSQVGMYLVHARDALRARVDGKKVLLEHSGILELERGMAQLLDESDAQLGLATSKNDLVAAINAAEIAVHHADKDRRGEILARFQQRLDIERGQLSDHLNDKLEHLLRPVAPEVHAEIDSLDGLAREAAVAQLNAFAADCAGRLGEKLNSVLAEVLPPLQRRLRDMGDVVDAELAASSAAADLPDGKPRQGDGHSLLKDIPIKDTLRKLPVAELTEQGVKSALALGKDIFPKLFTGIGVKTMGRWAAFAGKWAGPVIQGLIFAVEIFQAQREAQERIRQEERRAALVDDAAREFVDNLRVGYRASIVALVKQVFDPLQDWLTTEMRDDVWAKSSAQADLLAFAQVKEQLAGA